MKVWLDVTAIKCPNCGHYYVDASWYVVEIGSDIECGNCGAEFNSKKNAVDRVMLEYELGENGEIKNVRIIEHLKLE